LKLRDYPTLRRVVDFVREMRPELAASLAPTVTMAAVPVAPPLTQTQTQEAVAAPMATPAVGDVVVAKVLEIVANQTGYPPDMLELDLDMEADLGIDTVKQAETFAAIRKEFDIPRRDDLKLRDYPTLRHVVGFVREMRPELANGQGAAAPATTDGRSAQPAPTAVPSLGGSLEDADKMPRRVPVPALRPPLALCKPTGVTLDASSRVIVMADNGGVGKALVDRLQKRGVTVLALDNPALTADVLDGQIKAWLKEGAIQGVYWLPALDVEPHLETMDLPAWRELNRQRVKNLYTTMRALYESVSKAGTFLVSATRLGGLHGYGDDGASAPLGGAVVGFTKAYKRERGDVLVKAVDFEVSRKTAAYADALIAETLADPGIVEVGYREEQRYTVTLSEQPVSYNEPKMIFDKGTVFVVTGAAGGITSAIVQDLAQATGGVFYLLDLVQAAAADDPLVALFRKDKDALKAKLIEEARAKGEKMTPVQIDKRIAAIEREEAALRAIETVRAAGGTPYYYSVNLLDGAKVTEIVEEIRARHGRIDALIHAGGLEISRSLPDKDPAQFDLVFDVKADGFFSLLRAAKGMPIGATVVFSSVAGRFGNNGQTDYSAANDLLCKLSSSLKAWRPETRGIAIDWTAWGGIGMATRGSIPKIMEMAGIEMLPPQSGIPTVRRELLAGGGELVVGGKLGILVDEWDATGGLDLSKVKGTLMAAEIKGALLYGGLQIETTLDPKQQAFLYDHQMEGVPLLPGVMGTETFAQAARLLAPDYNVAAVSHERFESPFKFYRMEPQTLYIGVSLRPQNGGLVAYTTLTSKRTLTGGQTQEKLHFTAQVRLTRDVLAQPKIDFSAPGSFPVTAENIYRIYFHGPAYRVLAGAVVDGDSAVGLLASPLPEDTTPAGGAPMMQPRLIELCFQTAGIWEMRTKGVMALPLGLDAVTAYRAPEAGTTLYALVKAVDNGARFDARVVDGDGNVYVELLGYRTVQLPGQVNI
ncbi:MAG: SDR family NAD(P)-dependent oxidoreductase, partial [Chloroflexi bacterium]|nr:SDR family NAD(P)-dependent oxidoreductase [Chloroflexota bacterium]